MSRVAEITEHIVREYAPDVPVADLPSDYDLLGGGVIDSLTLLRIVPWVEDTYAVDLDQVEIGPDDFRTVAAIDALVGRALSTAEN